MMEAHDISYGYRSDRMLFKNVNMVLKETEIVGLYGKSGYGKTTLAKILSGYIMPLKGEVCIEGKAVKKKGINPVQLVGQHPRQGINPRWKMGSVLREAGSLDPDISQRMGIQEAWLRRYPSQLSEGEIQRFCIARAFASQTRFIIADEMTVMLDAVNQAQIWETVLTLAKERKIGLLVISHNRVLLEKICTRILLISSWVHRT